MYLFVIALILSTNFLAWVIVRVFYKKKIPLWAITKNCVMGVCAGSFGFWSIDIFRWLFSL